MLFRPLWSLGWLSITGNRFLPWPVSPGHWRGTGFSGFPDDAGNRVSISSEPWATSLTN